MNKSQIEGRPILCILTNDNWSKVAERVARLLVDFFLRNCVACIRWLSVIKMRRQRIEWFVMRLFCKSMLILHPGKGSKESETRNRSPKMMMIHTRQQMMFSAVEWCSENDMNVIPQDE